MQNKGKFLVQSLVTVTVTATGIGVVTMTYISNLIYGEL